MREHERVIVSLNGGKFDGYYKGPVKGKPNRCRVELRMEKERKRIKTVNVKRVSAL